MSSYATSTATWFIWAAETITNKVKSEEEEEEGEQEEIRKEESLFFSKMNYLFSTSVRDLFRVYSFCKIIENCDSIFLLSLSLFHFSRSFRVLIEVDGQS